VVEDVLRHELTADLDGSPHDIDVDQRPVLPGPLGDDAHGATFGRLAVDLLPFDAQVLSRGHEVVDVPTHYLLGREAEQLLGGRIPGRHDLVHVRGNDRLGTHLEQRLEEPPLPIHFRDVVVNGESPHEFPVRDHRSGEQLDVHDAPVLSGAAGDAPHVLAGRDAAPERLCLVVERLRCGHEIV
jgi:hypothetical protein